MEAQQLGDWLRKGLGRAVLALRDGDATPFRDTILDACWHDQRYDVQCEDSRGKYLFDVIQATGEPDFYRDAIVAALTESVDDDDGDQVYEIARFFAQAGDTGARSAIYAAFERNALNGDSTGAEELVRLDGLAGFLFAFQRLKGIEDSDDAWLLGSWISDLEDRDGKEAAWEALNEAAATDTRLKAILRNEREARCKRTAARKKPTPLSLLMSIPYSELRPLICQQDPKLTRYALSRWGERASDDDLLTAATDLLAEEDEGRLLSYLRLFWKRPFPLAPDRLLELADIARNDTDREANWALAPVRHPAVRAHGLKLLAHPRFGPQAIGMLSSNYEQGDELLIERALAGAQTDRDLQHGLVRWALDFAKEHIDVSQGILLQIYEASPCALCRGSAVRQMIEAAILPDWIREEWRWDSDSDTRDLVRGSADADY